MMRKSLRLAVIGMVVVLLGGIAALIAGGFWAQQKQEAAQAALDLLPNVAQRIQDFHRVKIRDGRKVWEVSAVEAQYSEEEGDVEVREPAVRLYLKDGRAVGISGQHGRIALKQRDLQQVEITGGVEIQMADYTARTERASYDRQTDRITAPDRIEITGPRMEISGDQVEVDVGAQQLRLYRNVTTILRPESSDEPATTR